MKTVTDGVGRYAVRSPQSSLLVTSVEPPAGYEGGFNGYGTLTPGEHNFVAKAILNLGIHRSSKCYVSDGNERRNVHPTVVYATGESVTLVGSANYNVSLTSSNPAVVMARTGGSGDGAYTECLAPGTAVITGTYWGVNSPPVTVEVLAR